MVRMIVAWIATMITYAFIDMGGPFGYSAVGFISGLFLLGIWVLARIYNVEEYRQNNPPYWMIWLADKPNRNKYLQRPTLLKNISIVLVIAEITLFVSLAILDDEYSMFCGAASLMLTWSIGVLLVDRHFRHNYIPRQTH